MCLLSKQNQIGCKVRYYFLNIKIYLLFFDKKYVKRFCAETN